MSLIRHVSLTSAVLLVAVAGNASAAVPKTVISGTLAPGASGKAMRVVALQSKGPSVTATASSTGAFSLTVPRSSVNGLSLQLLTSKGRYAGPVLLYVKSRVGAERFKTTTAATIKLGTVTLATGYAKLSKFLASSAVYSTVGAGAVSLNTAGAPIGAGRLGLVSTTSRRATARGAAASGSAIGGSCASGGSPETGPGGDCDADGVPNVVDVDDNGNLSLDMTDKQTSQTTAGIAPWSEIIMGLGQAQNANTGATAGSINSLLGPQVGMTGSDGLNIVLYVDERALISTATATPLDAVWATCSTGVAWCSPGTDTANMTGLGGYEVTPGSWASFHGARCVSASSGGGYTCTNKPLSYPGFGLINVPPNGGPSDNTTWVASIKPDAVDTLGTVTPGSLFSLNYRATPTGDVSQAPVAIQPYFVTTPGLKSYTTGGVTTTISDRSSTAPGTSQGNPIQLGSDNGFAVTGWRPQRFALPGEDGSFFDVGSLNYGLQVQGVRTPDNVMHQVTEESSCPLTGLSNLTPNSVSGSDPIGRIWPAKDGTAFDRVASPANTISLATNVAACLTDVYHLPTTSGSKVSLVLSAAGSYLTGGVNRSNLALSLELH